MNLKSVLLLMRPHQWLKNVFVFLPLFFDRHLMDVEYLLPAMLAFWAFGFAASGIYCFNDIWDVEADRLHPEKRKRPIASGAVEKKMGYLLMLLCVFVSFTIIVVGNRLFGKSAWLLAGIILFYIIMDVAYCVKLKQFVIVDVFIVAAGFVLRILVGGIATGIVLSYWIVLMTFLLALFLAFAKRRDDVVIYEESGLKMRNHVNRYNLAFMNQTIAIVASITMVCYIMYTVSPEVMDRFQSSYIYLTSIFVLAGIIRYLQITTVDVKSGDPTKVLMKDRFIQLCLIGWGLAFGVILYL